MVSVSDSSKEDCCEDAERGVDLGNDSDNLGFSELKSNEVFENRWKKIGDSESESSECLLKKSRVLYVNYGSEDPNVDVIETEVIQSELEENNGEGLCHSLAQTQTTQLLIDNTVTVNVDHNVVTGGESERVKFVSSSGGVPVTANSPEKNKDLIDALKMVEEEINDGCSETSGDFLETAKKRGMDFPRPRWWPLEGFDGD